jgi:hypothetical protein
MPNLIPGAQSLFDASDLKMLEGLRQAEANNWALSFSKDHTKRLRRLVEIAYELSERNREKGIDGAE